MKLCMSGLDIMVCVRELKNAIGARVDNVYELDGVFLLRLRSKEGHQDLLLEPGRRAHLTGRKYEPPKKPSAYAMFLRKHLTDALLVAVEQPHLERVIKFKFSGKGERLLILELFGKGNLVLCDGQLNIIQPHRVEVWRHRVLRAGERYVLPPSKGVNIRELDVQGLRPALGEAPDVVRALAINLNVGGPLAEEICARAGVAKSRKPGELSGQELTAIIRSIRGLLTQEPAARIVYEDSKPMHVLPFDFKTHMGKRVKQFDSFNEALDEFFSTLAVTSAAEKQRESFDRKLNRLRRRLAKQEKHFADLYAKSSYVKQKADFTAIHHAQINDAMGRLKELRREKGWRATIKAMAGAKEAGELWAKIIKKVEPKAAKIEFELVGQRVSLDLRLSVFENASRLYKQYKKLAEKAAGAKEAMKQTRRELEELLTTGVPELEVPVPRKRRKPKWFERYRWFISSDGMLVIGGRDAKTNREVVEKHMEPGDRYLHADIVGAPHVVIKTAGKEVPEATLKEAAQFAAMHSRAWREGLGVVDVYWVMPEQVSKRAPPGTYLPKGAYRIEGKRNFLKVPIRGAVGVVTVGGEQLIACGPSSAIKKRSQVFVEVMPGRVKKSELAREARTRLKTAGVDVSIDEVERALPPGKGDFRRAAAE
ncbi:MAG: ribosome rescue protein RqcH [Candidatus Hadarchaeaceae archaeon]